ncbi:MAG TPA: hypothetical protein VI685_16610 [Candidatus Angelobacter sp.]
MRKVFFATLLLLVSVVLRSAQRQAPPAPPQSPRQALIEMVNGQVPKHLTVEVQQLLAQPENKQALAELGFASSLKGELGQDVQLFESGPVLMSMNDPKDHRKIEVQVNNDDMSGDQDVLELSVHSFRDGVEQDEEWQSFLSHFTVTMVRQQDIWRLSKIGVGVELAIGDPDFLKKTYLKSMAGQGGMVGGRIGPDVHTNITRGEVQTPEMSPRELVMMLGVAEQTFASENVDVGFTCSLADLAHSPFLSGRSAQITSGNYNGYKLSLTGCQGKPAGSFQITVEPVSGQGGKAYCIDATRNIRVSDDGRGSTCLSVGRPDSTVVDQPGATGVGLVASPAPRVVTVPDPKD